MKYIYNKILYIYHKIHIIMKAILNKTAPYFKAQAYSARQNKFVEVSLDSYKDKYLYLFAIS